MDNTLLHVKNIFFSYRSDYKSSFINDFSFNVKGNDFVTILGPNGSGKSTLLKLIASTLKPTKGNILLDGESYDSIAQKEIAKKIAFVPQFNYSVFPFTVYEIVMMGRTPYLNSLGYEQDSDSSVVNDTLKLVGIEHLKNRSIHEISGGEAQRAFIARALVQQPELILLDEPSAHLDIKHQIGIFELLWQRIVDSNLTVIMVSHDLNLAGHFSNRSLLLKDGVLMYDDLTSNVLSSNTIKEIFDVNSSVEKFDTDRVKVTIAPNFKLIK